MGTTFEMARKSIVREIPPSDFATCKTKRGPQKVVYAGEFDLKVLPQDSGCAVITHGNIGVGLRSGSGGTQDLT